MRTPLRETRSVYPSRSAVPSPSTSSRGSTRRPTGGPCAQAYEVAVAAAAEADPSAQHVLQRRSQVLGLVAKARRVPDPSAGAAQRGLTAAPGCAQRPWHDPVLEAERHE